MANSKREDRVSYLRNMSTVATMARASSTPGMMVTGYMPILPIYFGIDFTRKAEEAILKNSDGALCAMRGQQGNSCCMCTCGAIIYCVYGSQRDAAWTAPPRYLTTYAQLSERHQALEGAAPRMPATRITPLHQRQELGGLWFITWSP